MPKHEKNAEQHSNTGKPATGNASDNTVAERIRANFHQLTRAERQLANTMLENYPVSGLGSITALAETSDVSAPTIVRMAKKLGFRGFPQLQSQLRHEVEETISNPITRHNRWSEGAPDAHLINRFAEAVMQNLRQTLANLDPGEFDEACAMMGDLKHAVHVAGGRITGTLAEYLFRHLQMIRPGTTLVPSTDSHWPHYVLDMHDGDTLVLYDVRRYENNSVKLAEIAAERGVNLILFTDQWVSPAARYAKYTFSCRIEAPSAWDSTAVMQVITETMIARIQASSWKKAQLRTRELEALFDRTGLFRRFK
ncbi:MAG: MurR/RpiR family transcriptional regulator [Nitratireductor sp.]|nr:MurR/RpiR family transcriptional regulator [Nitratireductor sp.]